MPGPFGPASVLTRLWFAPVGSHCDARAMGSDCGAVLAAAIKSVTRATTIWQCASLGLVISPGA